ncbi:MAG: EAL domain-containing protein [Burkholderiaceae bacterium]|jgi:diguanylate cyclase (GGDEF)-like protein/PAS domain S-box-containing protein|nr:EAL domain-containing protein [Burkholderiaceae bacterium]
MGQPTPSSNVTDCTPPPGSSLGGYAHGGIDGGGEALQRMHAELDMQAKMLDASVDCIKLLNTDGTLAHMNLSGCRALGVSPESGFGMKWLELLPPEVHAAGQRAFRQALRGSNARFSGKSAVPGKTPQYWDNNLTPVLDDGGNTVNILCVSRDVTLQRETEERLRKANGIDELTELPNRRAFHEQLRSLLQQAGSRKQNALLMMIDLDHFKYLNDTLGHAAGDHLLQVVARRIQGSLPASAFVARLGGDEFAVLVQDIKDDEMLQRTVNKVMAQLDPPIHHAGKRINGSMSAGCAIYPRDASDPGQLASHADVALNDMKASGRGGARFYSASMLRPLEETAAQLEQARRIVREGWVQPYYQPKIRLADRRLVGLEALLRSQNPGHAGLQTPAMVQAAFRDFDLSTRMAEALRARVFSDIAGWLASGLAVVPVSINAAPVEFMRDNYAERLLRQLEKAGVDPAHIELEVTEQTLDERGAEYVARALNLLRQEGIRVALDDFGTGHSSLTRLRNFPVDCLKIDANFVGNFGQDPAVTAVVNAIGQIGSALSLELVAEGIETEPQCRALEAVGFSIGQGHLFSKAVSADAIAALLSRSHGAGGAAIAYPAQATVIQTA